MSSCSEIFILVSIEQSETREHILKLLAGDKLPAPPVPFTSLHVEEIPLLDVEERLHRLHGVSNDSGVVLISDGLVDEHNFHEFDTSATHDLLDAFGDSLFTMIAVMRHPARVCDIERSISQRADESELGDALDRCLQKLAYLCKPPVSQMSLDRYDFRVLRFEHELHNYFHFRRDVYSTMCYLDDEMENTPSGLEMDWFDKSAVHLGVYFKERCYAKLVGTGRLIATEPIAKSVPCEVSRLSRRDPILQATLQHAVNLQLPALQSHEFFDLVGRMLDMGVVVGEISRVIVAPEHRGLGLSLKITEYLIRLAKEAGLSDLLLECLPVHTPIYHKCGFKLLPNASGRVYKIGRTMDVMGLPLQERSIFLPSFFTAAPKIEMVDTATVPRA